MTVGTDLQQIEEQEAALRFDAFDLATAWELGKLLRDMAEKDSLAVAIDVHLHAMPAFYAALPGSTADNASWIRRKRNLTLRLFQSSYRIGLTMAAKGSSIEEKLGLATADFAGHGGSFPILVKGTGCIGAVTVSGLPQRDDHNLVVEALALLLVKDAEALRLQGPHPL